MKTIQTSMILYENDIQKYCDEYLISTGIEYFRVPDTFWRWVHKACSVGVRCWLYKTFGSLPDMIIQLPIDDRFCLAINCELKRPGTYLRASQKAAAGRLPWVVCKTPDDVERVVCDAQVIVQSMKAKLDSF